MPRKNRVRIDAIEIVASEEDMTAHGGMVALVEWLRRKGVLRLLDERLPQPRANNGYAASQMVLTIWALIMAYGEEAQMECIDDLRRNEAVVRMLGMKEMPSATAVGDWLRRMGNVERQGAKSDGQYGGFTDGLMRMKNTFYEVTAMVLQAVRPGAEAILDFDASPIEEKKKYSEMMYTGEHGTMGYFAYAEGVCVMAELEPGNHSPNDHAARRTISCFRLLKRAGTALKRLRADSASYNAATIKYCMANDITYWIRAANDPAVKQAAVAIPQHAWAPHDIRQGATGTLRTVTLGRTVHAMEKTPAAFHLVVKRDTTVEPAPEGDLAPQVPVQRHAYWCIATNDTTADARVLEQYNARGGEENRHKELKRDLRVDALPCRGERGLDANRVYAYACAMLYNLFFLFKRECFAQDDRTKRLPTVRRELLALPARITRHAGRVTVRLANYAVRAAQWLSAAVKVIRAMVKPFHVPAVAPAYGAFMYRRE